MNTRIRSSVFSPLVLAVIGLLAWTSADVRAEDSPADKAIAREQAKRARQAQIARELVPALELNRGQARRLVPIVEEAAKLHLDAYEQQAQFLPEIIEALGEFAQEDQLNQGFTRDVERRTARLNHRAKEVRDKLMEDIAGLEKQATAVLTASQRERLESWSAGGQRPMRGKTRGARNASRSRFRSARKARQEAVDQRLRSAREELTKLHRQTYGQAEPGPVGRFLLHPAAAEPLCKLAGVRPSQNLLAAARVSECGTSDYPISLRDEQQAEVVRLRGEINNWNLINGLHLTRNQIDRIVALHDAAVPNGRATQTSGQRATGVPRFLLTSLERSVEEVMNPGQRQVVGDYKACLIPPKNLKDPVRVGQASDRSHHERWLARARKASGPRLIKLVDGALEAEAKHLGELSPAEHQQRKALLLKTARQVAKMSDADFELNKAELAESIAPPNRKKELEGEIAVLQRERGLPGRVAQFMLKPDFIEQVRARGRQLAEGVQREQTDLAQGPQAENCEKGCAIDGEDNKKPKRDR